MTINPNTRSAAKLPDWLSPREFALWADVNEETVRRWLRAMHKPKDGPAEGIKAAHSRGIKRHHGNKGRLW